MKKRALAVLCVAATIAAVLFATETRLNRREPYCGYGTPPPALAKRFEKVAALTGRDAAALASPTHHWCSSL